VLSTSGDKAGRNQAVIDPLSAYRWREVTQAVVTGVVLLIGV